MSRFAPPHPYARPLSPSVAHEWSFLRFPTTYPPPITTDIDTDTDTTARPSFVPRPPSPSLRHLPQYRDYRFRAHTPPSHSPSPCPSLSSTSSSHRPQSHSRPSMLEIEELADGDGDSGIELLHGEFEDAPETYGQDDVDDGYASSDSDDDHDVVESEKRFVLQGMQRLWRQEQQEQQQQQPQDPSPQLSGGSTTAKKRSYAESLDGASDGDTDGNNTDSSSGGRIRRRKLAPLRSVDAARSYCSRASTPELIMEMEL